MTITYDDIKHKLQPPLDCSEIGDLRGQYFYNRLIINCENADFAGCVLYHCFPSGMPNALDINPAQSESDLTLKGADLLFADLQGANLQGANLEGADLYGANLVWADLRYAILVEANLEGANLEGADLYGANLVEANLEGAILVEANLQGADLQGAEYNSETNFKGSTITQKDSMLFVEDDD
jgi:uncharacterized protein YjbI with pentapeptide repeats